ncbi:MAG TPA: cell wall hydrolase, partial [Sphingopyxis sp.]|nr:cell wall hydrolase [Sphingopyxis sp.]
MKPELNLAAHSPWLDPAGASARAAPDRRWWIGLALASLLACLALVATSGQLRAFAPGSYSVSVPLEFKPYDPTRWAIMNAEDYEAALKLDPTLPDPD